MARSSSFAFVRCSPAALVLGGAVALASFGGCTRSATVGENISSSAASNRNVEADNLLRLGLVAVQNPEDRNLVMQEKSPQQILREALLNYYRAYPEEWKKGREGEGSARRNAQNRDDGAEEGRDRYTYELKGGSLSWVPQPDGSSIPVAEGFETRQPVLRFNNGETFDDAIDHLNQWIATRPEALPPLPDQPPPAKWTPDPLVQALPADLRNSRVIYSIFNELPALKFNRELNFPATHDGWRLQEVVWLRDVSTRVTKGVADPLEQAKKLFDWTVRSIQLLDGPGLPTETVNGETLVAAQPLMPWQNLLLAEGHIEHRAWLFTLLARQQALDVVVLELPDPANAAKSKIWAAGLLHDKQLYLFDLELGAPIPGPGGRGVATIAQAAVDPSVLTALDLPGRPYPFKSSDVGKTTAFIEATPQYLSRRMGILQSALTGANQLVLTVNPSRIAFDLKAIPEVGAARIWEFPYSTIRVTVGDAPLTREAIEKSRTALFPYCLPEPNSEDIRGEMPVRADMWCARVADLKGKFIVGAESGGDSDDLAVSAERQAANPMYLGVRKQSLATQDAAADPRTPPQLRSYYEFALPNVKRAAQDASLYLGLVAFERAADDPRLYNVAVTFFQRDVLKDSTSPRRAAAHYCLGRTLEVLGKKDAAIAAYRADDSPQKWASQYRALQLEKAPPATAAR